MYCFSIGQAVRTRQAAEGFKYIEGLADSVKRSPMRHLSLAGSQLPGIMGRTSSEDTEAASYMQ